MRTDSFDYDLPQRLIAERPPAERDGGRMCVVQADSFVDQHVRDFPEHIEPGDLLVLNETRVRRARLACHRARPGGEQGGKVELLFLEPVQGMVEPSAQRWRVLGRANRPLRVGDELLAGDVPIRVLSRGEQGTLDVVVEGNVDELLERVGQMPIPPYLHRNADEQDVERYQTVYAKELGSAAAPTAGLHLTPKLLQRIEARGGRIGRLVLHVGIGTFRPVSVDDLDQHIMHSEWLEVDHRLQRQIAETRGFGGRVIAVGTTVVRALESARDASISGGVRAMKGPTDIFIQPGYRFHVVDGLWTNFHMPKSTLLALVSAFAGHRRTMDCYRHAVRQEYRFLSYGDAMWIPGRLEGE